MYLFCCVIDEFKRINDFAQTVLKKAKNIPLLSSDYTYTIKNKNAFSVIITHYNFEVAGRKNDYRKMSHFKCFVEFSWYVL